MIWNHSWFLNSDAIVKSLNTQAISRALAKRLIPIFCSKAVSRLSRSRATRRNAGRYRLTKDTPFLRQGSGFSSLARDSRNLEKLRPWQRIERPIGGPIGPRSADSGRSAGFALHPGRDRRAPPITQFPSPARKPPFGRRESSAEGRGRLAAARVNFFEAATLALWPAGSAA